MHALNEPTHPKPCRAPSGDPRACGSDAPSGPPSLLHNPPPRICHLEQEIEVTRGSTVVILNTNMINGDGFFFVFFFCEMWLDVDILYMDHLFKH